MMRYIIYLLFINFIFSETRYINSVTIKGNYSVDKNDSVLVIAANKAITITTSAIALENGQIGDMIPVKSVNSEKIFKVIITGKKKLLQ